MAYDRVSEFGSITLDYSAAAALTVKFYAWLEGGVIGAATKTLTFPLSATRTQRTLSFEDASPTTPVEGTHFQVEITCTGIFRLFGGKVTHRPIPVYVNGAATPSEKWLSPVMSIEGR
ncbi:MAG: hypothetical protein IT163_09890 [Bryobacterales bacterium]|nr:hypothetical protein [Bryobacterales bacterium]